MAIVPVEQRLKKSDLHIILSLLSQFCCFSSLLMISSPSTGLKPSIDKAKEQKVFSLRDPNPIISNVNRDRILAGWRCFLVRSLIWAIETYWLLRQACCHDSHEFHPVRCRGCNAHMQPNKQGRSLFDWDSFEKPNPPDVPWLHRSHHLGQASDRTCLRHVYNIPRMWTCEKSFNHCQCGFNMF